MQIAVCDDNVTFLREIEGQLTSLPMAENVFLFPDVEPFLHSVRKGKKYDAVLMDINFQQEMTGMDAARELFSLCPSTKVIYVTGDIGYSQQVFLHRANLSGFVTKPVDTQLLQANLQKVSESLQLGEEPTLMLRQGNTAVSIPLREIYHIESKGHTVNVLTGNGETVIAYDRIANIISSLPAEFTQCHKSYIVNMRYIRRFEPNTVIMKNDMSIPVSRSKYNKTKEAYFRFIGRTF